MGQIEYKVIIGLEIHVHLATKSKMFCGCALEYGAQGNSRVCPVCLGLPGSLPVMNKQALEYAVLAGLALNCEIAGFTKWDRKNYYYPDLPKNYQISQYDLPFSSKGNIEISVEGGQTKKVGIIRAHLEEDAGKNLHGSGNYSQVDLNRTGTPLLEIVTEPDMNSAAEVRALAVELQRMVRYLGVSEGDMQKGHMRFEPNVNLHITTDGVEYRTPIAEIKNLNSFRALERSVEYEERRQLDEFLEKGIVMEMGNKTTRGWDDEREITVLQREKEEAHDYRYFPEPDLVPVELGGAWLEDIKSRLCELPLKKQMRYVREYGLSDYDAGVLTGERTTAGFFEATLKAGGQPKPVCKWIAQQGLRLAKERGCKVNELGITPEQVAELTNMVVLGDVSSTAVTAISNIVVQDGGSGPSVSISQVAREHNLIQKSDAGELESIVEQVLEANSQAVADVTAGGKKSKKAIGFLLGQVMQKTKGQANPRVVSEILNKRLG